MLPAAVRLQCDLVLVSLQGEPDPALVKTCLDAVLASCGPPGQGRAERVRIALVYAALRSILPLYETRVPYEQTPRLLLELLFRLLQGTADAPAARTFAEHALVRSRSLFPDADAWEAGGVLELTVRVVLLAIQRLSCSGERKQDDQDLILVLEQVAEIAMTLQDGMVLTPNTFWTWWLKEAIPFAWHFAMTPSEPGRFIE